MKEMTPEAEAVLALVVNEPGLSEGLRDTIRVYRASLKSKPRYTVAEYINSTADCYVYDGDRLRMTNGKCAEIMNLSDRYERALLEISEREGANRAGLVARRALEEK